MIPANKIYPKNLEAMGIKSFYHLLLVVKGFYSFRMIRFLRYTSSSFFLLPGLLWAEPEVTTVQPVAEMNPLQIMTPLLMVIALIFMVAWLVKRFNPKLPSMGKEIEILSSTQLSTQSRLALIRVGGKDLLIGITPQSISLIKEF
ncbi:MAG: flagellar biosynthetic protein FliO, partial [Endozoicomonas sp.]